MLKLLYNQMYSVCWYSGIVLSLIGGFLIDRIGVYFTIILFSVIIIIGQGIFTVSGYMANDDENDNFPFIVSLIGRFVFGLGGDILSISQSYMISKWFREKELALSLGIVLSISWTGNTICNYTIPPISNSTSLGFALSVGLISWFISLFASTWLILMDRYADRVDRDYIGKKKVETEKFHWRDIKHFPFCYWIIAINCMFTYSGLIFNNISNDFFVTRYGFTQEEAARIGSNAFVICAFLAPIFGIISDKLGHKVSFTLVSTICLTLCHVLFILIPSSTPNDKTYLGIIPIAMMGVTSSIYAAVLFPMIPLVVSTKVLGSAYGIVQCCLNIGLAFGPILVGGLTFNDKKEDKYVWVNFSLGIFWTIGILFSIILMFYDKFYLKGILQKPTKLVKICEEQQNHKLEPLLKDCNSDLPPLESNSVLSTRS